MCGRYVSPDDASIEREFGLVHAEWRFPASFNVAPSRRVPVVRRVAGRSSGALLRWGLVPHFAKGTPGKYSTFNARAEGLAQSASFRGPWRAGQRCLVPALGFYEWHVNPDGGKQPYYVHLTDQPLFGFAGLWDRSVREDGTVLESCTIITLPANALMAEIHNAKRRMPAILPRALRAAWLEGDAQQAAAALAPYPDAAMRAYPVSQRVNSPRNDEPSLIDPVHASVGG